MVSLCDDYSLPVDFVNKRRSRTLDYRSQGRRNQVEVVDEYFDPRDSKLHRQRATGREKLYTSGQSRRHHHRHSTPIVKTGENAVESTGSEHTTASKTDSESTSAGGKVRPANGFHLAAGPDVRDSLRILTRSRYDRKWPCPSMLSGFG
ncbi:UNVERIFIED_CONTAM: hypothetical protein PYX00_008059 [Menopon gallinae]|uniref:Uncharacterized protein n=1 Tax=Menopon gallinae TaxID=328185 RepID=A0AAW2HMS0_9NEOP